MKYRLAVVLLIVFNFSATSQSDSLRDVSREKSTESTKWYDKIAIRGYGQVRYNRLFETNPQLRCEQCDKSWGEGGGIFLRRMRIVFYGQIHPRVFLYVQPDFASGVVDGQIHYGQIRDAYFDVGLDRNNEFRFRIGQSKIPFGFENMQSSSNRLPLDRNDALNSSHANERDMGVFFYWAPKRVRKMFSHFTRAGLKGSGDFGVVGFGVYNGQTANRPELNDEPHVVGRVAYPFVLGKQIIEPGIQAYYGQFEMRPGSLSSGVGVSADRNYLDTRVAGTFVLYPQPFGIQAEYNIGKGPEFNKVTDSIEVRDLHGGYATLTYKIDLEDQIVYPFLRGHYYEGGKKHERDARSYSVRELEIGIEWLPVRNFELVAMYTFSERRFEDFQKQDNVQSGRLLRLQAQVNF